MEQAILDTHRMFSRVEDWIPGIGRLFSTRKNTLTGLFHSFPNICINKEILKSFNFLSFSIALMILFAGALAYCYKNPAYKSTLADSSISIMIVFLFRIAFFIVKRYDDYFNGPNYLSSYGRMMDNIFLGTFILFTIALGVFALSAKSLWNSLIFGAIIMAIDIGFLKNGFDYIFQNGSVKSSSDKIFFVDHLGAALAVYLALYLISNFFYFVGMRYIRKNYRTFAGLDPKVKTSESLFEPGVTGEKAKMVGTELDE